jgi:hypothetical protein
VLVSDPGFANSLTIAGAASAHYALSVITVVAAVFLPVMLLYQGWTYHVRGRGSAAAWRRASGQPRRAEPPWRRSTGGSSAARGRCGPFSPPTRRSGC